MKQIICSLFILAFLTSCKECGPGKKAPEVSFEVEGVYSVHTSLIFKEQAFDYGGICLEIQKPDTAIVRFVGLKEVKDVHTKWQRIEEGKYEIDYDGKKAFFYENRRSKPGSKSAYLIYLLTFKDVKPAESETNHYTSITKLFNDTLDDCTSYKREEMNQDPDPGPDN